MTAPLWYKDAIFYELRVGTFCDSDGDGIGDFRGLTEKLGYLQDMGVTTLWILPFYPSPFRDDGYDIADYTDVHPNFGTLKDFKVFLKEAHRRGLKVVTELVVNHTSDQHPWFQRARRAKKGSPHRNYYVWSDTSTPYPEARIIFKDFETSNWSWDPVAKQHYWHRFYSHQPDLNYDNPALQKEIFKVIDFWFGLGVDGMRLDAVPYLFEREGTNCENLPETHTFLKQLRKHVDQRFSNRMLLAEANQWPEDAVTYFGNGDECHMAFHFPVMPRLFMSIHMEDRFPLIDIFQQTPPIADNCQWAIFLRNHDELTLEMVTDEERDYMYRVYANDPQARINLGIRRRLAPLLGNDRRRIELMNGLLFSLPGTPVLYYGDEIGMGDNFFLGDRNGVRTPMQWSSDRNAGFSNANPQRLYLPVIIDPEYHYETINVEAQQGNPHSLLWWMKRLIALRKRYKAFGQGSMEPLDPKNRKVLAYLRRYGDEIILVVANLSRFVQFVELDLTPFKNMVPVELFGQTDFPPITEHPYFLSIGPRAFYWFVLHAPSETPVAKPTSEEKLPILSLTGNWDTLLKDTQRSGLEEILPAYLRTCRWFRGKGRKMRTARIIETIPLATNGDSSLLTWVQVDYREGSSEIYLLPLSFTSVERLEELRQSLPQALIAILKFKQKGKESEKILYDPSGEKEFSKTLWEAIRRRRHFAGEHGQLKSSLTSSFRRFSPIDETTWESHPMKAEQSNTSVIFGSHSILKLFRVLEEGVSPELEIGKFLTEETDFKHFPRVGGFLEYRRGRSAPMTAGVLTEFIANEGDGWKYTLDQVDNYFERAVPRLAEVVENPLTKKSLLSLSQEEPLPVAHDLIGTYLEMVHLIGTRTAELHMALASSEDDPQFVPEPFTTLYQRSLYQSMRNRMGETLRLLKDQVGSLPTDVRHDAQTVLGLESRILKCFQRLLGRKINAVRIRCHGDYHLGQLLFTGKDFMIFDFEGEPARPLSERQIKRSPLRDVAGLIRSFHYAVSSALIRLKTRGIVPHEKDPELTLCSHLWYRTVTAAFLKSYLEIAREAKFLPKTDDELDLLINLYLLDKAIYELGYEINNRPDWLRIPLAGMIEILELMP